LRNKIEKPFGRRLIHTVVGMGYVLRDEPVAL
jgi:DNA-binding response OmpR family regulator